MRALIYQRATSEADRQIADRLSEMVDRHRTGDPDDQDGDDSAGVPAPVG